MSSFARLKQIGWLVPLRLALYTVIFSVVVIWMRFPEFLHVPFLTYSFFTLAFAITSGLERRIKMPVLTQMIIAIQFCLEVWLEGAVIYASGNINSQFSALFILTIVSASLVYRLVGTLVVASLVSTAYSYMIWLGLYDASPETVSTRVLQTILQGGDSLFYAIFLHILLFYLVAFMAGYMADRLRREKDALADTSSKLRQARLETDDILRHLNSGLLTVDARGQLIYFNQAAERILGYREEDVKGMPCEEVFAERMPDLASHLRQAIRDRADQPRLEFNITDADGANIPLGVSISVLMEEELFPRGVIAIFSDLTQAKALEAKVRAADRLAAVGELSASIAHEIRNPLAAISGSVEVLANELTVSGENARLMTLITKESDRLSRILTDFLAYARLGSHQYAKVDLNHTVNEVIELISHHGSNREGISISVHCDDSVVYVLGDEGLVKQVLLNLVINACEAFDDLHGSIDIVIRTRVGSDRVLLMVHDSGPGIAEDRQDRLFEPFYSTKKEGTGLGLAIVHRICALLKLDLHVDSRPGQGTTFLVGFQRFSAETAEHLASAQTVTELTAD